VLLRKLSIVMLGPAGSGKTSLASALGNWLEGLGYNVAYINLDPAVEVLPYKPTFDARDVVRARDVMLKEGLGPNGAIIRSIDILSENYEYLGKNLMNINSNSDLMIVDTPGQLEILMFRNSGLKLINIIKEVSKPVGVFLLDPTLGLRGNSAAVVTLMAIVIRLGLGIPTLPVLSKADLINVKSVIYSTSYYTEVEQILDELRSGGEILTDMLIEVLNIVKKYLRPERLLAVSALNGYGIEDLYKAIHEIFCTCGDLT